MWREREGGEGQMVGESYITDAMGQLSITRGREK